ncbi:MAG: dihydrofolate reductase family protein [Alistipes sp.]|nr:dihydrofolate reductase family protein [Alistipes sp.]
MRITLSYATSKDGYLDDCSKCRLTLSTSADWEAVYRLRSEQDAILIGAETLRRDNPSLKLVPMRVVISRSGNLDPEARFFTVGEAQRVVFTERPNPALERVAEVILCEEGITARRVVTELERRGVNRLMVEGGAKTLQLFLDEGLADEVREAVNPTITVGEEGYAHFQFTPPNDAVIRHEELEGMQVTTTTLHPDTTEEDMRELKAAIDESRKCTPDMGSYCVGAVVLTADGSRFTGYTHETSPTHHAEQEALKKAIEAGAVLRGATIYASMEPCSTRKSEPKSCTQLILEHGLKRVVFACYEPSKFVRCDGACTLRAAGVDVRVYPDLAEEVLNINGHLF